MANNKEIKTGDRVNMTHPTNGKKQVGKAEVKGNKTTIKFSDGTTVEITNHGK